jgi:hypothetical protein
VLCVLTGCFSLVSSKPTSSSGLLYSSQRQEVQHLPALLRKGLAVQSADGGTRALHIELSHQGGTPLLRGRKLARAGVYNVDGSVVQVGFVAQSQQFCSIHCCQVSGPLRVHFFSRRSCITHEVCYKANAGTIMQPLGWEHLLKSST